MDFPVCGNQISDSLAVKKPVAYHGLFYLGQGG